MPHTIIREEDNTIAGINPEEFNVVYIPGLKGAGQLDYEVPTLFGSLDSFYKALTGSSKAQDLAGLGINAVIAKRLISMGLYVLYEAFALDEGEEEKDILDKIDWDKLRDKGLYVIKYLTTGGYSNLDLAPKMLQCAKNRGDCIALIDHEKVVSVESGSTVAETVSSTFNALEYAGLNLKFGAAFTPWCKFRLDEGDYDLPGSFAYLSAYANSILTSPNWYASAGKRGGVIPGLVAPLYNYGEVDCDILQSRRFDEDGDFMDDDNTGIAVNPICKVRPFGYVVWGNRTLVYNNGGLTASSFLNIRNMCCDIKKDLYNASNEFKFEQNTDVLWANFCARISPLLDKMLSGNGIRGYKSLKEKTSKKGCVKAKIAITPIEPVEDFDLTLEMTDSLDEANIAENID